MKKQQLKSFESSTLISGFLKSLNSDQKGQLMLEAMIAITIAVMGILGFLTLLSNSVGLNRVVTDQYIGNYLAAEGIEVVKNIIDNNGKAGGPWNNGLASGGCFEVEYKTLTMGSSVACDTANPLKFDDTTGIYSYQSGADSPFSRIITVTPRGSDEVDVNTKVSWKTRGGSFTAVAEDHFFNWRL